jgi:hypothetical protein
MGRGKESIFCGPMKNHVSTADLAIWIVLIACRGVLCLCIMKKRLFSRLPWFSVYVLASTIESVLLLVIAFFASYAAYYSVFYVTSHIVSMLAFLTLIECGRRILPGLELPQKEKAFGLLFATLAAVIVFASFWPMRYVEKRIDLAACLAIAVTFIFIAAYSRRLGLSWSRLLAGIASSLGFLYLVQGATRAITGHYPSVMVLQVRQVSQSANVLAVIAWIVVVLSPWGTREFTEQDVRKIEAAFARIEASVGTGEVKTV